VYDNLMRLAQSDTTGVMNDVVDHILNASIPEKKCWDWAFLSQNICDADPSTDPYADIKYREAYGRRMAIQPVATEIASRHKMFSLESVSEIIVWKTEEFTAGSTSLDEMKATAIYVGLRCLEGEPNDIVLLELGERERDDIDYITRNVDAIELLIGEIASRHTLDRGVIDQLLSSHPGLSSGNL
jgi:ribosomal protein L20A (L18A)